MDAGTDIDLASNDLGPLAWVLDELRKSLESASAALRRFVRDAGQARGSDMASVDTGQLRIARQQLHQAVGALEMVGLGAPAQMLRAMESAVQRFTERPELCVDAAAAKVERAGVALTEYLEGVLQGKLTPALALFPQYRDVQELAGSDRVHPADLWLFDWRWNEPALPPGVQPQPYAPALRSRLDQAVLRLVKTGDAAAAAPLVELCLGLAAAQQARQPRVFWQLCAGFFEGLAQGLIPFDVYAKRAASRVLMQYASLAKGELGVSDRQAQDLLFFCAQAQPRDGDTLAALASVREAWGLGGHRPVDYEQVQFGRFDPALLAQMRKRIGHAKESWSALAGGDINRLRQAVDQFGVVGDTLMKLHPGSAPLARALVAAADVVARTGQPPRPELAMEVATAVLYLEAAFQDLDPSDAQLVERTGHLADRLERVRQGGNATALEPWMEELYRRVSDRQTMGSVVGELRNTLGDLEKQLDAFFRKPQDMALLQSVPGRLQQMRGVLSVLGLDQAVHAVGRMRDTVEDMLLTELDEQKARAAGTFDKLGNNLGALGFLIDMLNYQPTLAKKLFVFDEDSGELRPLMGRVSTPAPQTEAPQEIIQPDPVVPAPVAAALTPVAAPTQVAAVPAMPGDTDDELLDIFLEEAREVVVTGLESLDILASQPSDAGALTTLRRAFHTLKGSSRMVGLTEFGEAAWSLEQLLNTWLADQKPASEDLCSLSTQALHGFRRWAEDIGAGTDPGWKAAMFRGPADALRTGGPRLPLALPGDAAPAAPAAAGLLDGLVFDLEVPPPATTVPLELGQDLPLVDEAPAAEVETSELDIDWDALVAAESTPPQPMAAPVADRPEPASAPEALAPGVAPFEPPPESSPEPAQEPVTAESAAADLDALFEVLDSEPLPAAPAEVPPLAEAAFDLDLDLPGEPVEASAAVPDHVPAPAPAADPVLSDLGLLDSSDFNASTPDGLETRPPELLPQEEFLPADEQTKVIGDLRIGIPLYNVYLNEADEWSRRLQQELGEWALELGRPVPESTVGLAHALGGSSATVGFHALSGVARSLEAALLHTRMLGGGTPAHGGAFVQAADEIRRLLHQFAAGFLKQADPDIVATLDALAASPLPVRGDFRESTFDGDTLGSGLASAPVPALDMPAANDAIPDLDLDIGPAEDPQAAAIGAAAEPSFVALPEPVAEPVPEVVPEPVAELDAELDASLDAAAAFHAEPLAWPEPQDEARPVEPPVDDVPADSGPAPWAASGFAPVAPRQEPLPETPGVAQAVMPAVPRGEVIEGEEDIDAVDAIDPDLFPVFEDEAAELLPRLGGALRGWAGGDASGRDQVLRALHTLKGSARLAGALRLGEMAHRMESAVEQLGHERADASDIDPLLPRLDALLGNFERLRQTGAAQAVALTAEPAPLATQDSLDAPPVDPAQPLASVPDDASPARTQPVAAAAPLRMAPVRAAANQAVRVRSQLLERLMNRAGEVMITRSRLENELRQLRSSLSDLTGNLDRLRAQLRDIELQAETQMQSRLAQAKDSALGFDPLEFDRFTRVQELTRMMAESVNDVATVQRNLQRTVEATEDDLIAQARQTRELQRDLLRTRMVEFDAIADRLYRVVRLASKETGKQVKLDITGASIEMDRGVLDRMVPAFEHLLRNCVAHGIESPQQREAAGKEASGTVHIALTQDGNDVAVEFRDDGAGLDLERIRARAVQQGLLPAGQVLDAQEAANLIFLPGLSTASEVTELAGRGIGMDVVRSEVNALGGRIETSTQKGAGTTFKLVLPLTTAVTQVVMLRSGDLVFGVPSNLVELVRRATVREVEQAYVSGSYDFAGEALPFFWSGALLQASQRSNEPAGRTLPVVVLRSAAQRVAFHVDEVLGNQEVVVKNLGPQLARLPGLAGMTVLPSGAVVLIYNPVALAAVYGEQARGRHGEQVQAEIAGAAASVPLQPQPQAASQVPLVLVVDDSITVRRVTQRLLTREGWRVALAADGLQALERLAEERPALVLSDIEMPRMDGFDLVRNIRADARWASLPVVMITSRIAGKHRDHARELGVNHYLGKPYAEEELLSLVRHYAERATADAPAA